MSFAVQLTSAATSAVGASPSPAELATTILQQATRPGGVDMNALRDALANIDRSDPQLGAQVRDNLEAQLGAAYAAELDQAAPPVLPRYGSAPQIQADPATSHFDYLRKVDTRLGEYAVGQLADTGGQLAKYLDLGDPAKADAYVKAVIAEADDSPNGMWQLRGATDVIEGFARNPEYGSAWHGILDQVNGALSAYGAKADAQLGHEATVGAAYVGGMVYGTGELIAQDIYGLAQLANNLGPNGMAADLTRAVTGEPLPGQPSAAVASGAMIAGIGQTARDTVTVARDPLAAIGRWESGVKAEVDKVTNEGGEIKGGFELGRETIKPVVRTVELVTGGVELGGAAASRFGRIARAADEAPLTPPIPEMPVTSPQVDAPGAPVTGPSEVPEVFRNLEPNDVIVRPELFPAAQIRRVGYTGRLDYVVLESGELVLGKSGHISLARGEGVLAAGEARFFKGAVKKIDNFSGHYRPSGDSVRTAAEAAFDRAGFDAAGRYAERKF